MNGKLFKPLQEYFKEIARKGNYDTWYFGHWHEDVTLDKYKCLWQEIVDVE